MDPWFTVSVATGMVTTVMSSTTASGTATASHARDGGTPGADFTCRHLFNRSYHRAVETNHDAVVTATVAV